MALPLYRCGHDHDSFRHRFPAPVRLGLIKSGPLTNREIEKLDAFLLSDGGLENAMDVSTLDGFLCAVPIDDRNWSPLRPMLCDCFKSRRRLEAEILVLRHQLNVLQQRTPRRLYLRWADRALLIWLYRRCPHQARDCRALASNGLRRLLAMEVPFEICQVL